MTSVTLAAAEDRGAIEALLAQADSSFDVEAELDRVHARLWVARAADGAVVGCLLAWYVADEIQIIDVVVGSSHRRRGVGRDLLRTALAYGTERRARLALLEVRKSNDAALALYRGFGFEVAGEREGYYGDGEDAWLMQLVIGPC